MERMRKARAIASSDYDIDNIKSRCGIDIYFGKANFISKNQVAINGRKFDFFRAIIATGG